MIKYGWVLGLLWLVYTDSLGQRDIPVGSWRTHLNYSQARYLAITPENAYCATANSLFYLNKEEQSLNLLSKIDGLSDINISALGYSNESATLVIGYQNGSLDFVIDQQIINLDAIFKADLESGKRINHISFFQNKAYLSTDYGLSVIDLNQLVVAESYFPGPQGEEIKVWHSQVFQDSLFIATENGVLAGSLAPGINLIDFRNWQAKPVIASTVDPIRQLIKVEDRLYGASKSQTFLYNGIGWKKLEINLNQTVIGLASSGEMLLLSTIDHVYSWNGQQLERIPTEFTENIQQILVDGNGFLWLADQQQGLVSNYTGSWQNYFPDGPAFPLTQKLLQAGNLMVGIPAQEVIQTGAFQVFSEGSWENYLNFSDFEKVAPLTDLTYDRNKQMVYFGSQGDGLITWSIKDNSLAQISKSNESVGFQGINGGDSVVISSVTVDQDGILWVANAGVESFLHKKETNWESFSSSLTLTRQVKDLIVYPNGDKWMIVSPELGGGILVYNEINNQYRHFTTTNGNGGLPDNQVNDLELDQDGFIWVASQKGIAYFANPFLALTSQEIDVITPIFEQRLLLNNEIINTIETDGGNRKWIGTDKGVWLMGQAGEELFYNFTASNSPLLSDKVFDIAIQPETGEVFFATAAGLISFRSTATEGGVIHSDVKIFPNPVNPQFEGLVAISGLANNAIVKITDVSGKLIWQDQAYGGTASWNRQDYLGRQVKTGIYLVFSADFEGEDTFVGKIAIVQ
ncbi:MAG: two-component regulator propeller domain-containing protein [Candidatus Cyclobacteriaceae bacterium M3_2C_046]